MVKAVLIGAGQRGAQVYAEYALKYPNDLKIVAVAEPDEERRAATAEKHHIDSSLVFSDWRDLLKAGKIGDCAMVCTQDRYHVEPVKEALKLDENSVADSDGRS